MQKGKLIELTDLYTIKKEKTNKRANKLPAKENAIYYHYQLHHCTYYTHRESVTYIAANAASESDESPDVAWRIFREIVLEQIFRDKQTNQTKRELYKEYNDQNIYEPVLR